MSETEVKNQKATGNSSTAIKKWQEMNPLERRNSIEATLKKNAEQLAMVLPNDYSVGKLIGTVLSAVVRNPKILECTQASIFGSIWAAAQIGLDPNGLLGEGSLLPYYNKKKRTYECQFIPGYRGFIKLAYKSPLVRDISADVVYEKDEFRYNKGLHPDLYHVPTHDPVKGEIIFVYCVVHLTNGGFLFDVMDKNEIETIRLCSPNSDGNAWVKWYAQMAKKSIIRRQFKTTPLSQETSKAVALDEKVEILNESQRNELDLVNSTVFADVTQEIDQNDIYAAEETEYEDISEGQETKSDKVMNSALNQVKVRNGNGHTKQNNNGGTPDNIPAAEGDSNIPDDVEFQLRKLKQEILFLIGEICEYKEEKNEKMVKKLDLSLMAAKLRWRELTGKEFKENE